MADGAAIDVGRWTCPAPLRDHDRVVIGHGGGGTLSAELIEHVILPAFGAAARNAMPTDAAVIDLGGGYRLAFTTDTFVVRPLFFPGGNIGDLAVNGTVNDLAMQGARPLALSTAFVLEEGLELEMLGRIAAAMGTAATTAGVELVTGDTKVVESGHGDGLYINTAGIGLVPAGVELHPDRATPGDCVIVSGPIGMHGVAVLSVREGLEFGTELCSDTAPLGGLVETILAAAGDPAAVRVLRDPTRGGVAATVCEIAAVARVGIELIERSIPVPDEVQAACGFLGLDPIQVANEGRLVAVIAPEAADRILAAMRATTVGAGAAVIGVVSAQHPTVVTVKTPFGASRVVDRPLGEQLPRIC
ncbi:MAG: hydrogenase expression/formation protein HypE [Solirubrobacteraceae bacterium]